MFCDQSWSVEEYVRGSGVADRLLTITSEGLFLINSTAPGGLFHVHLGDQEDIRSELHTATFLSRVLLDSKNSGLFRLSVESMFVLERRESRTLLTFKATSGKQAQNIAQAILSSMKLDVYLGLPAKMEDFSCGMFVAIASPFEGKGRQSLLLWCVHTQ